MSKQSGFSLIEVLVVLAIIGVLAAIAIPQFAAYRKQSFDARSKSDLTSAAIAEEAYFTDNEHYVNCTGTLDCEANLPGFVGSQGVTVEMFIVPPAGPFPEHCAGIAFHPSGTRPNSTSPWTWNSTQGGVN